MDHHVVEQAESERDVDMVGAGPEPSPGTSGSWYAVLGDRRQSARWVYRTRRLIQPPPEAVSVLHFARPRQQHNERLLRIVNVVLALAALVVLSPILLLTAIAIKLTSPGPVLYRQTRVGIDRRMVGFDRRFYGIERRLTRLGLIAEDNRREDRSPDRRLGDQGGTSFTIYKFRSMRQDAEARTGAVWASKDDPRVTPLGRFLRASRIDELPQLFNVLRGDMNIVGPRPERPVFVERLSKEIEEYRLRQRVRPGITGLAQINHCYDSCVDDVRVKVRYDLEYIGCRSLRTDLSIMFQTIGVMASRRLGW